MDKKTKYYVMTRIIVVSVILIILLSLFNKLFALYRYLLPILFDTLTTIFKAGNIISIILLILTVGYLIYQIYLYTKSRFYQDFKISVFEAIYHGFIEIHLIYDQLVWAKDMSDLNVDMKQSIITFRIKHKHYCLKYLELFGVVNNKMDNEMWGILSKPKKEFGRKRYTKKLKFPNPARQLNEFIDEQKGEEEKEIIGYVVLNGFFKTEHNNDQIIAPYEVLSILE